MDWIYLDDWLIALSIGRMSEMDCIYLDDWLINLLVECRRWTVSTWMTRTRMTRKRSSRPSTKPIFQGHSFSMYWKRVLVLEFKIFNYIFCFFACRLQHCFKRCNFKNFACGAHFPSSCYQKLNSKALASFVCAANFMSAPKRKRKMPTCSIQIFLSVVFLAYGVYAARLELYVFFFLMHTTQIFHLHVSNYNLKLSTLSATSLNFKSLGRYFLAFDVLFFLSARGSQ